MRRRTGRALTPYEVNDLRENALVLTTYGAGMFDQNGVVIANGEMDTLATQPRDVQFALKMIW